MMELHRYKMRYGDCIVCPPGDTGVVDRLTENMFRYHSFEHLYRPCPMEKGRILQENICGIGVLERIKEEGGAFLRELESRVLEACREIDEYMRPYGEIVWDFRYMYCTGEKRDQISFLCLPAGGELALSPGKESLLEKLRNGSEDGFEKLEKELLSMVKEDMPYFYRIGTGEKILMNRMNFMFGKSRAAADYVVDNKAVSRRHASILFREGDYYLEDLGSTNGTFLNDSETPVGTDQKIQLHPGDRLTFADEPFQFLLELD